MKGFNFPLAAVNILREKKYYNGKLSKIMSTQALKAAAQYIQDSEPGAVFKLQSSKRLSVAVVQCYCREKGFDPGKIDGYAGPQTYYAVELLEGKVHYFRDEEKEIDSPFPLEKDVQAFYGNRGENQVRVKSPYRLVLAWNNDIDLDNFYVHEKCADSCVKAMEAILKAYGDVKIREMGINQFGGSLNVRLKRGSKTQWSIHSWGAAIDWFPQNNQLRWGRDRAWFARPEYSDFLDCWENEGWFSLGRARNFDWMHVQAARL